MPAVDTFVGLSCAPSRSSERMGVVEERVPALALSEALLTATRGIRDVLGISVRPT